MQQSLDDINAQLANYFRLLTRFHEWIGERASQRFADYLSSLAAQEKERAGNRLGQDVQLPTLLAERRFLHRLERMSRRLSPLVQHEVLLWLEPLVLPTSAKSARKVFNTLRYNGQGRFYKSPWSTQRHQPIDYDRQRFFQTPWFDKLNVLQARLQSDLERTPCAESLQDFLEVKRFYTEVCIQTLPAELDQASLSSVLNLEELNLHDRLRQALKQPLIKRADASNLLTWIGSQLSRMRFFVRRKQFIVRHKFSREKDDELIYVPKDKQWSMPAKYFDAKEGIGPFLRKYGLVKSDQTTVNVKQTFDAAIKLPLDSGSKHLLMQMPHDWYVDLNMGPVAGVQVAGLPVGKDAVNKAHVQKKAVKTFAARLRGASASMQPISEMLLGETKLAEWMLILDWTHNSTLSWGQDVPRIHAQRMGCQARLAAPITRLKSVEAGGVPFFNRMVSIDLGERQLGYAVFDVAEALETCKTHAEQEGGGGWPMLKPVLNPDTLQPANGAIRIAGVRRLIEAVKGHRGRQASNSKLRQNFDTRLQQLRESVTSEVVQKIEALCARYGAFPVLESAVVNFQTGSRQLDLVYGDVVRHFAFSNVPAHAKMREEHWMGAERWLHPYLMKVPYDETVKRRQGKAKPLNLFPGATVAPAGTSQVCVCCGRNAFTAFRKLEEAVSASGAKLTVQDGGMIDLEDGRIRLFAASKYSSEARKEAHKQKINLPLNVTVDAGGYTASSLWRFLKMTARQKNPNQRARDTTQSWYHCLYADCAGSQSTGQVSTATTYHADAGAAVNIGRKFFATEIDWEASCAVLSELQGAQ